MAAASQVGRIVLRQMRRDQAERKQALDATPSEQMRAQGNYQYVTPPRGVDHNQVVRVWKNCTPPPIDTLLLHARISERQHAAAVQYRDDHATSGFERRLVANYEVGGVSSSSPDYTGLMAANIAQHDARLRLRDARKVIPSRLVIRFEAIVIEERTCMDVGGDGGFKGNDAPRIATEWLRISCDQLADWYRIA